MPPPLGLVLSSAPLPAAVGVGTPVGGAGRAGSPVAGGVTVTAAIPGTGGLAGGGPPGDTVVAGTADGPLVTGPSTAARGGPVLVALGGSVGGLAGSSPAPVPDVPCAWGDECHPLPPPAPRLVPPHPRGSPGCQRWWGPGGCKEQSRAVRGPAPQTPAPVGAQAPRGPQQCGYLAGRVGTAVGGGSQPASSAPPAQSATPSHLRDAPTQPSPHHNSPAPQGGGVGVTPCGAGGTLGRGRGERGVLAAGGNPHGPPPIGCGTWRAAQQLGAEDDAVVEAAREDAHVLRLHHAPQRPHHRRDGVPVTLEELRGERGCRAGCGGVHPHARPPCSSTPHPALHIRVGACQRWRGGDTGSPHPWPKGDTQSHSGGN